MSFIILREKGFDYCRLSQFFLDHLLLISSLLKILCFSAASQKKYQFLNRFFVIKIQSITTKRTSCHLVQFAPLDQHTKKKIEFKLIKYFTQRLKKVFCFERLIVMIKTLLYVLYVQAGWMNFKWMAQVNDDDCHFQSLEHINITRKAAEMCNRFLIEWIWRKKWDFIC